MSHHGVSIAATVVATCWVLNSSCTRHEAQRPSFLNHIPTAKYEVYSGIRDAAQWKNPYLVVRPNGVEILHVKGLVEPDDLESVLASLPVTAWPYGRVVAVQELGIQSANDGQRISEVRAKILTILEDLSIEASIWPSA